MLNKFKLADHPGFHLQGISTDMAEAHVLSFCGPMTFHNRFRSLSSLRAFRLLFLLGIKMSELENENKNGAHKEGYWGD